MKSSSWFTQLPRSLRPLGAAIALAVAFGACDEKLNGGAACPLCPSQPSTLEEDTLFAVIVDTSIAGYPNPLGGETQLYVATLGDTLETAAAIRFDTLPKFFRGRNSPDDSTIAFVDTGSYLKLSIITGDTLALATTIELYDIDMQGAEEDDPTVVASMFTPDRLLASRTVPADSLRDSVKVPIDPLFLMAKIFDTVPANRVRLGVRVAQAGNPKLTVRTVNTASGAELVFRPSADTGVPRIHLAPHTRAIDPTIAFDMSDYLVVRKEPPPPPPGAFRVGSLPARRAYLRFDIPPAILDSSRVVRATLLLTQRPSLMAPEADDTVGLGHFGVVAGGAITDLRRALFFLNRGFNRDTVFVLPADSGIRTFEMIEWVRGWRGTQPHRTPRSIALVSSTEGENGRHIDFFSIEAPAEVRPRLRITYLPRNPTPLP